MKALRQLGFIEGWRNGENIDDVIDWLDQHGPVIVGVDWFSEMNHPGADGFVSVTGRQEGGHCFEIVRYDLSVPRPYFLCLNSWGHWGPLDGYFKLSIADMDRLLFTRHGDVAVASEITPPPPPLPPEPELPPLPPEPDPWYPWQDLLTVPEYKREGLVIRVRSTRELHYLLAFDLEGSEAAIPIGGPMFWAQNLEALRRIDDRGRHPDYPDARFFVQRIQVRHRADWNA
jgi:hypothetical protein